MFSNLLKAAVGTVLLPVDIVYDAVAGTDALMGGDHYDSRTKQKINDILENLDDVIRPE